MVNSLLFFSALAGYFVAALLIARYIRSSDEKKVSINPAFIAATIAALAHLAYAYNVSFVNKALNFSVSSMAVLVSGIVVAIYMLGSLAMPIRRLGILVFPLTIISLLFSLGWEDHTLTLANRGVAFSAHILVSIVAYSLIAIAAIQAMLYAYQERQIKNRTNPAMLMALPPLQTMEQLLFRLVGMGFVQLTLTLLSGAIFSQQLFGYAFEFKHHTILASLGWLVFAILLVLRVINGLRGSQAVIWTISGFLLIQLGYFGTKIVSESLSI